jgi:LysR family transcriptional regulator, nitrogen assimilation regulatory protein
VETRRLSYFVRIAEDGSLTKAAGVLRIAQPALSRQIRLLEEELGVPLFSRTARGMQLTEAGEHLRASVAGPLRELELVLQNIRSFSSPIEGNIAIGMPSNIGDILARPLAFQMDADHPSIKLRIVEGCTGSLIDWLNRGIVDFALLEEGSRDERLADRELLVEPLMLVGAASSSLSEDRAIEFKAAAQLPLIMPAHHLGIRGALNDAAAAISATLNIRFQADAARLIKELVLSGMGYAILPMAYFKQEYAQGKLKCCPIINPDLLLTTFLSSRKNSQTNRASKNNLEQVVFKLLFELLHNASPSVIPSSGAEHHD